MRSVLVTLLCFATVDVGAQESVTLKLVHGVPLSGVKGRFDHFAIDARNGRLFVAALGNDSLEVIDVSAGKRLKSVGGLHKPQGVVFLEDQNQIVVANGGDGTVKFFDGADYRSLGSIDSLEDADNLRFDAASQRIYVGYGDGALGVIDGRTKKHVVGIGLKGHPESFQLEASGDRIYVNVPDARRITVVDRRNQVVIAAWALDKVQANFPMALDESDHRLFVGCRQPARLLVLDTSTGKTVADLPLCGDTDDLFYDAKRRRIYVSCGEGFLDVIEQHDTDSYERLERIATRAGARTSFYSAARDELFLALPQRDGHEAELRIYQPR